MPVIALTQRRVETLECGPQQKIDYFDSVISGLVLQVRKSGARSFYYRERNDQGKTTQLKLGDAKLIRLSAIKRLITERKQQQAEEALTSLRCQWGMKPAGSARSAVSAQTQTTRPEQNDASPSVSDFLDDAYLPFIRTYKRSYSSDLSLINNHVKPFFGSKTLAQLNKTDLLQFIDARRESHMPGTINRVLILMRYVYNLAIKWETPGVVKNPVSGTPLLEENNQRERFLTSEEVDRLVNCVRHSRNEMLQYIVPGLILTGARKQELLRARWQDFCQDTKIWRIPMSKSGKARHVPISDALQLLLDSIPKRCEWVFANPKTLKPLTSFYYSWDTARNQAGLADVRVHDLRHSFASFLVNNGRSLYEVQRILGHTQIKTTQRYAHLDQESLLSAVNTVSAAAPNVLGEGTRPVPIMRGATTESSDLAGEGGSSALFDLKLRTRRALRKKPSKRREDPVERALIERAEALRKGAAPVE